MPRRPQENLSIENYWWLHCTQDDAPSAEEVDEQAELLTDAAEA